MLFTRDIYDKVMDYLSDNLYRDKDISELLSKLETYGHIILVGGAIKDIGFFNAKPKDFDLIVKTERKIDLASLPDTFEIKKNSFGEYKLIYKNLQFDIMTAKNKREVFDKSIQFNIDGLSINISTGRYNAKLYNETIRNGYISIVNNKKNHPDYTQHAYRLNKYVNKFNLKVK